MPSTVFKTLDIAIGELRAKGMLVSNSQAAKCYLDSFSVYNVINGYADIFNDPVRPGYFKTGSSFSELKAIHHFDEGLRRCLTHNILRIESIVKSRATYQFCDAKDATGNPKRGPCDYLMRTSYDSAQGGKITKLIADLLSVIRAGSVNPGPIKDYLNAGITTPPIWVIATGMTFGNTLKFYECLLPGERNQVARSFGIGEDVLDSFLLVLRDFRNSLAHSNRVFCFRTVHRPKRVSLSGGTIHRVETAAEKRFGSVLFILRHLLSDRDFKSMINEISTLLVGLSKKLKTITVADIASEMGIPNSMKLRYGLRLS